MPNISEIKQKILIDPFDLEQAFALVYGCLPLQKLDMPIKNNPKYENDLTSCSLMAEFALIYFGGWTAQQYVSAVSVKDKYLIKHDTVKLFPEKSDTILIELPGHNIVVFHDEKSDLWAGLQAWDGKFYLFNSLNKHLKNDLSDHNAWYLKERNLLKWIIKTFKENGGGEGPITATWPGLSQK